MKLGPYELLEELARGGMGSVHRARDATGRELAIKLLQPGVDDARFEQEAEAAARLRHPGIVTVHAFARDAGRPYLVMELVPGRTLAARLRDEGPLPPTLALDLALQLCDALAHAHAEGVLHRDLKPQNVILQPDGRATLTDFGLARVEDQSRRLTQTGELLGTPAYMPPEQIEGDLDRLGPASDVYGLGATLYTMLCGRPPFAGASPVNVLSAALGRPPQPFAAHGVDVPADLERVVHRCLEKDPARRYPTVEDLALGLQRVREGAPDNGRTPWRVAVAAAAALTLTLSATALLARSSVPPPRATAETVPTQTNTAAPRLDEPSEVTRLLGSPDTPERLRALHGYLRAHPDAPTELRQAYRRLAREVPWAVYPHGDGKVWVTVLDDVAAAVSEAGRAEFWTPRGETPPRRLAADPCFFLTAVALGRDALWVSRDNALGCLPRSTGHEPRLPELPPGLVGMLATSPDGRRLAVEVREESGCTLLEFDLASGAARTLPVAPHLAELRMLAYSPDGARLAAVGRTLPSEIGRVLVWAGDDPNPRVIQLPYLSERLCFDAGGQRLAVGSKAGDLHEYAATGEERAVYRVPVPDGDWRSPRAHLGTIRGVAYAPDGARLYSVSKDGEGAPQHELRIWETGTTPALLEIRDLPREPLNLALSADGSLLLLGTYDGAAEAWLVEPLD